MLYRHGVMLRTQEAPGRRTRYAGPPTRVGRFKRGGTAISPALADQQMINFVRVISLQGRDWSSKIPRPCVGAASGLT